MRSKRQENLAAVKVRCRADCLDYSSFDGACLRKDDDLVPSLVQVANKALQQSQFATLLPQLLGAWIQDRPIQAPSDQIWVVAVLAHLHENVVQAANDICSAQALCNGLSCLLHQQMTVNRKVHCKWLQLVAQVVKAEL